MNSRMGVGALVNYDCPGDKPDDTDHAEHVEYTLPAKTVRQPALTNIFDFEQIHYWLH